MVAIAGALIVAGVTAAASALSSVMSSNSAKSQAEQADRINTDNAIMGYNMGLDDLVMKEEIASLNYSLAGQVAEMNTAVLESSTGYNIDIIRATTLYNNQLLNEQLDLIWEAADLDITQVEQQRKRERGEILAVQSASGTVIDEGSNKEFVIAQKTQEEMDISIIEHNADLSAREISNAKARNQWEASVQIAQTEYEGKLASFQQYYNSAAQAVSSYGTALAGIGSGYVSNASSFTSGMISGDYQYNAAISKANTDLTNGMFTAVAKGVSAYASAGGFSASSATTTAAQTASAARGQTIMSNAAGSYSGFSGYTSPPVVVPQP